MIEFVLVIHIWTGLMSKYESQSMAVVYGFKTAAECRAAGELSRQLATGFRESKYVCMQRTAP